MRGMVLKRVWRWSLDLMRGFQLQAVQAFYTLKIVDKHSELAVSTICAPKQGICQLENSFPSRILPSFGESVMAT